MSKWLHGDIQCSTKNFLAIASSVMLNCLLTFANYSKSKVKLSKLRCKFEMETFGP